jgi:hypothetical protein
LRCSIARGYSVETGSIRPREVAASDEDGLRRIEDKARAGYRLPWAGANEHVLEHLGDVVACDGEHLTVIAPQGDPRRTVNRHDLELSPPNKEGVAGFDAECECHDEFLFRLSEGVR